MMQRTLPDPVLHALSDLIVQKTALLFAPDRWNDLDRNMGMVADAFGFQDRGACAEWLLKTDLQRNAVEKLASCLTVGETYFFRDTRLFRALENDVFPTLIHSRYAGARRLRLWSAGCCTGEEPYSLAILLHRLLPDIATWNLTLLATDINPAFLAKAVAGRYTRWSFRDLPAETWRPHFDANAEGHFTLHARHRSIVSFSQLNLAEDAYPSLMTNTNALDLILCRNVLMYLEAGHVEQIVARFWDCLVEGGWLIVSPTELSSAVFRPFTAVHVGEAILYRKLSQPAQSFDSKPQPAWMPPRPSPEVATQICTPLVPVGLAIPAKPPNEDVPRDRASSESPLVRARALYDAGHFGAAFACLRAAGRQIDAEPAALQLMARLCANRGELDEALLWCERARQASRLDPNAYYLRAVVLREQGRLDEAAEALRQTLYLDASLVVAHFAMGELARARHQVPQAHVHWRNALDLLAGLEADSVVPESDGLSAGRLREIIESSIYQEASA